MPLKEFEHLGENWYMGSLCPPWQIWKLPHILRPGDEVRIVWTRMLLEDSVKWSSIWYSYRTRWPRCFQTGAHGREAHGQEPCRMQPTSASVGVQDVGDDKFSGVLSEPPLQPTFTNFGWLRLCHCPNRLLAYPFCFQVQTSGGPDLLHTSTRTAHGSGLSAETHRQ